MMMTILTVRLVFGGVLREAWAGLQDLLAAPRAPQDGAHGRQRESGREDTFCLVFVSGCKMSRVLCNSSGFAGFTAW